MEMLTGQLLSPTSCPTGEQHVPPFSNIVSFTGTYTPVRIKDSVITVAVDDIAYLLRPPHPQSKCQKHREALPMPRLGCPIAAATDIASVNPAAQCHQEL